MFDFAKEEDLMLLQKERALCRMASSTKQSRQEDGYQCIAADEEKVRWNNRKLLVGM